MGVLTEADNMAIKGVNFSPERNGIITSKIEHDAVLNPCKLFERVGFKVKYAGVDKEGIVDVKEIEKAINSHTAIVSIMHVNNEIGTIQPISEIAKIFWASAPCLSISRPSPLLTGNPG